MSIERITFPGEMIGKRIMLKVEIVDSLDYKNKLSEKEIKLLKKINPEVFEQIVKNSERDKEIKNKSLKRWRKRKKAIHESKSL